LAPQDQRVQQWKRSNQSATGEDSRCWDGFQKAFAPKWLTMDSVAKMGAAAALFGAMAIRRLRYFGVILQQLSP
jgi:hypothetical protein